MKFQNPILICNGQTNEPKAICPFNFFKVWGIKITFSYEVTKKKYSLFSRAMYLLWQYQVQIVVRRAQSTVLYEAQTSLAELLSLETETEMFYHHQIEKIFQR